MKPLPLTEVGMLAPFVGFLEERGMPANRALDQNNLSREMVGRGKGKITKLQFYQFLNAAGPGMGMPDLGYRIGERYGMRFMEPVGSSVLRAATLGDAVQTFAAHLGRWLDGNKIWMERDGSHVWLCKVADDGLLKFQEVANQCAAVTLISLVREVAGRDWTPRRARLNGNAAKHYGEIEALANSEVERGRAGVAIQFPAEFLSRPILAAVQSDSEAAIPSHSPEAFVPALERTLADQLPYIGVPTIPRAAEIAGTSPRTLQRQLDADGLTYRRLIDRIRFRLARERLRDDPNLTTRELAGELHFSSPSSFVRSFRRIVGVTPGAYAKTNPAR